jgi:E3 ubiquitin-protein ligase DOA10
MHVVLIDPCLYMLWYNRLDFIGVHLCAFIVLELRSSPSVMSGNLTLVRKGYKNSVLAVDNNFGIG